jgi:hypothetical protein
MYTSLPRHSAQSADRCCDGPARDDAFPGFAFLPQYGNDPQCTAAPFPAMIALSCNSPIKSAMPAIRPAIRNAFSNSSHPLINSLQFISAIHLQFVMQFAPADLQCRNSPCKIFLNPLQSPPFIPAILSCNAGGPFCKCKTAIPPRLQFILQTPATLAMPAVPPPMSVLL